MSLHDYGLPLPDIPTSHETTTDVEHWTSQQASLQQRAQNMYHRLNAEQHGAYDSIAHSVVSKQALTLFIEGKAGTGKTTVITMLDEPYATNVTYKEQLM